MKQQIIKIKGKKFKVTVYNQKLWDIILNQFKECPLSLTDDSKGEVRAKVLGFSVLAAKFENDEQIKEFTKLMLDL